MPTVHEDTAVHMSTLPDTVSARTGTRVARLRENHLNLARDSASIHPLCIETRVMTALDAAMAVGGRFAARARQLAESQGDENRREELLKIAQIMVAGYSAYYTRIPKPLQDGIIARTEHRI